MEESKHKSHIDSIEELLSCFSELDNFLKNDKDVGYEEWSKYVGWINNQKTILQECLKKLKENYSYSSIFPSIREAYENFWFINLSMNGIKHYRYFRAKKGHDIEKIYKKWVKDLEVAHKKKGWKDILEICRIGKRIRITYRGERININGKPTNELIPHYYFIFDDYDPVEAYVGKQKKIIEKYLTPPHLFHRFVLPNMNLRKDYFEFQHGILPHLLLNKLITEKHKQKVIIHYNFLSLWSHPNKIAFRNSNSGDKYMDRLILLYIGNITKMFLTSFLEFLNRQEKEGKISKPDKAKLKIISDKINNFENLTSYFWFIYNKPSKFYKYDYAIHKIWRKHMIQKSIVKVNLSQIKDSDIPYYNNPLESLKKMNQGWTNVSLGQYHPEIKWE